MTREELEAIEDRAYRALHSPYGDWAASLREVPLLVAEVRRLRERCSQVAELLDKTSKGDFS